MNVKVEEFIGESNQNWKDAVQNAVNEAQKYHNKVTGVEIYNLTADVQNGQLMDFKANVKIAYTD